jgi:hypothetical protein
MESAGTIRTAGTERMGRHGRLVMHPITFAKNHPVAVITNMALGMIIGPWILGMLRGVSGVGISLPSVGGNGG